MASKIVLRCRRNDPGSAPRATAVPVSQAAMADRKTSPTLRSRIDASTTQATAKPRPIATP